MSKFNQASVAALLCAFVSTTAIAQGAALNNTPPKEMMPMMLRSAAAPAVSNHGHFVCTAAINAAGGLFSGEYVNTAQTMKLGTGTYQVGFNAPCADVRIALGWYRIAQPDTLSWGTLPARSCIVADRAGVSSAIWLQCYGANGALVDTSFTLSVSR